MREVARDDLGRNPNHAVASLVEKVVPFGIVLTLIVVYGAVNLHDEPEFGADEIDDVGTDRVLSSEAASVELATSEHRPEALLRWRRTTTLVARGLA